MSQDYKTTLHLPATDFPMRGDLPKREPAILERWERDDFYAQLRAHAKGRPLFLLHDGPPYANGQIHLGHAVNKILKDIIIKSKHLDGFDAPYIPGWDCHGLPIEIAIEKKYGKVGVTLDAVQFRQKCREYAAEQIQLQRRDFKRLGIIGDWDAPYKTLDFRFEADEIRALAKIVDKGHLIRGTKPVHWCFDCGSALAEAEIEYTDKISPMVDVAYPALDPSALAAVFNATLPPDVQLAVPIWTTTPWTLPASLAICVGPTLDYVLVEGPTHSGQRRWLILAEALAAKALARYGIAELLIHGSAKGAAMEQHIFAHPFYPDRTIPLLLGNHVSAEDGTGAVHTAPGHGQEDHQVFQQYGLLNRYSAAELNPVDARGVYLSTTPPLGELTLAGLHIWKANPLIVDALRLRGVLLAAAEMHHSYPHCWRHKTPIVFRATPQWFISMEQAALRSAALKAITHVTWYPQWGQARILSMIENRPDWTISRQRTWGVPIPLFVHRHSGAPHPRSAALMRQIADRVQQQGVDIWYSLDQTELLGTEADQYEKITDILDVWFDSGITHEAVLLERGLPKPADLYLEGADQHRGWFQSSLLTGVAMDNAAPYKQCLTHGFTVDQHGRKMSKSLGNGIEPQDIIKTLGADILRLWIASTDYSNEMSLSQEILKRTTDAYRRIRNTARFLLGNLHGFDPTLHLVPLSDMIALDRWIVHRAFELQQTIKAAYTRYDFAEIVQTILNFCSVDLGSLYLDVTKDRLYTMREDAPGRRSAQTAMYHLTAAFVRWIAPILSFTADELWSYLPGDHPDNVLFTTWYDGLAPLPPNAPLTAADFDKLLTLRDHVTKVLEPMRANGVIGAALEAEITVTAAADTAARWQPLTEELRFLFITGDVTVTPANTDGFFVSAQATTKAKCARCWHYRADIGAHPTHPELCGRCITNVDGPGEQRHWF